MLDLAVLSLDKQVLHHNGAIGIAGSSSQIALNNQNNRLQVQQQQQMTAHKGPIVSKMSQAQPLNTNNQNNAAASAS